MLAVACMIDRRPHRRRRPGRLCTRPRGWRAAASVARLRRARARRRPGALHRRAGAESFDDSTCRATPMLNHADDGAVRLAGRHHGRLLAAAPLAAVIDRRGLRSRARRARAARPAPSSASGTRVTALDDRCRRRPRASSATPCVRARLRDPGMRRALRVSAALRPRAAARLPAHRAARAAGARGWATSSCISAATSRPAGSPGPCRSCGRTARSCASASWRRATRRGCYDAMLARVADRWGVADAASRRAHEDPAARRDRPHVRRPPARDRRRRRPRQADDRRRHLLQLCQRRAGRRRRRRRARDRSARCGDAVGVRAAVARRLGAEFEAQAAAAATSSTRLSDQAIDALLRARAHRRHHAARAHDGALQPASSADPRAASSIRRRGGSSSARSSRDRGECGVRSGKPARSTAALFTRPSCTCSWWCFTSCRSAGSAGCCTLGGCRRVPPTPGRRRARASSRRCSACRRGCRAANCLTEALVAQCLLAGTPARRRCASASRRCRPARPSVRRARLARVEHRAIIGARRDRLRSASRPPGRCVILALIALIAGALIRIAILPDRRARHRRLVARVELPRRDARPVESVRAEGDHRHLRRYRRAGGLPAAGARRVRASSAACIWRAPAAVRQRPRADADDQRRHRPARRRVGRAVLFPRAP